MACSYCYIKKDKTCMAQLNKKIIEALADGSYLQNIKHVFSGYENNITSIDLWGAEPTLNGKYFNSFIDELCNFFPKLTHIMFSTNAYVGGEKIYSNFIEPMQHCAEKKQRFMTLEIQFSLDGPDWINDYSRKSGATAQTLSAIDYILTKYQSLPHFSLILKVKPTLDISFMKIMCERGLESYYDYFNFFSELQKNSLELIKDKNNITIALLGYPTLVDPGDHSKEDGLIFASWLSLLRQVDTSKLPLYESGQLFLQAMVGIDTALNNQNFAPMAYYRGSCSAGKNNLTIDYAGNLYICERLTKNLAYEDINYSLKVNSTLEHTNWDKKLYANQAFHTNWQARRLMADAIILMAARNNEIDKKYLYDTDARTLLFYSTLGLICHIGIEEDITNNCFIFPLSYVRLLGNGALDELLNYYFERKKL